MPRTAGRLALEPPALSFHFDDWNSAGSRLGRAEERSLIGRADCVALDRLLGLLTDACDARHPCLRNAPVVPTRHPARRES